MKTVDNESLPDLWR